MRYTGGSALHFVEQNVAIQPFATKPSAARASSEGLLCNKFFFCSADILQWPLLQVTAIVEALQRALVDQTVDVPDTLVVVRGTVRGAAGRCGLLHTVCRA